MHGTQTCLPGVKDTCGQRPRGQGGLGDRMNEPLKEPHSRQRERTAQPEEAGGACGHGEGAAHLWRQSQGPGVRIWNFLPS